MSEPTEVKRLRGDLSWVLSMENNDKLDALLDATRREERETLATGLDTRAEALAHGHGVAGNISGMSDEEFERRLKAAGKGCTVCARIELLAELAAALREGA